MDSESDKNAVAVVAVVILLLLLVIGGAGAYYVIGSHRMALEQAERARMAEAQARMQVEQARATAKAAVLSPISENQDSSVAAGDSIGIAVEAILHAQADAWNRGDLAGFMDHYWKSESLTFSSGGKTTRGWTEAMDRYRKRYPTTEKMGHLKFGGLQVTPLGDSAALVLGQWNVEREKEPLAGNFSLVVRKIGDRWLIIHDHTSRISE